MSRKNKFNRSLRGSMYLFVPGLVSAALLIMALALFMTADSNGVPNLAKSQLVGRISLGLLFATPVIFVLTPLIFGRRLSPSKRHADVAQYAASKGLSNHFKYPIITPIFYAAQSGNSASPISSVTGQGWQYYELDVAVAEDDKYLGHFVKYHSYYSVLEVPLPRNLPNLFFDSLKNRALSMAYLADDNQRLAFEGNFDTFFAAYSPAGYEIDTLSFISPEVMQALITADAYDIEIYGNRLYLYSDLIPVSKIDEMATLGLNIYDKLMNNIVTYSDGRLPKNQSRVNVAFAGKELKAYKRLLIMAAVVIGAVVMIPLSVSFTYFTRADSGFSDIVMGLILLLVPGGAGLFGLWKIYRLTSPKS